MLVCPLVSFREKLGLSILEMANECQLGVVIIKAQEKGIPHHLHERFLDTFNCIDLIEPYQEFRVSERRRNFAPGVPPKDSAEFLLWLDNQGLTAAEFSELACMPEVDVKAAMRQSRLPSTLVRFFEEINSDEHR